MTGLDREIRRRWRHAARVAELTPPRPAPPARCSAGYEAARCCVGDPWAGIIEATARMYGEPLPPAVIRVAAQRGVEPHELDHHVEGVHGWEPHDRGYDDHVAAAADCLLAGGCE